MEKVGICDKCNRNLPVCCGEEIRQPGGDVARRGVCRACCPEHGGARKAIRPPPPPVMPKPVQIPADWKKRALAAEAKLAGYRRLRELADKVYAATTRGPGDEPDALDGLIEDLGSELYHLDVVDPPKDFLNQKVDRVGLEIRTSSVMGETVAAFDPKERRIEVNADAPPAAQFAGLLYQLMQAADLACLNDGLAGARAAPDWLQTRSGALLALLIATGLLNPKVPVEYGA